MKRRINVYEEQFFHKNYDEYLSLKEYKNKSKNDKAKYNYERRGRFSPNQCTSSLSAIDACNLYCIYHCPYHNKGSYSEAYKCRDNYCALYPIKLSSLKKYHPISNEMKNILKNNRNEK